MYVERYISDKRYIEKLRVKGNGDESDNDVRVKMRMCQRYVHIADAIVAFPPIIQFGRRQFALTGRSVGVNFSQSIPLLHARSAVTRTRENPRAGAHNWKTAAEIDRAAETPLTGSRKGPILSNRIRGKIRFPGVILIPSENGYVFNCKLNC